jgi:hypothetical protein
MKWGEGRKIDGGAQVRGMKWMQMSDGSGRVCKARGRVRGHLVGKWWMETKEHGDRLWQKVKSIGKSIVMPSDADLFLRWRNSIMMGWSRGIAKWFEEYSLQMMWFRCDGLQTHQISTRSTPYWRNVEKEREQIKVLGSELRQIDWFPLKFMVQFREEINTIWDDCHSWPNYSLVRVIIQTMYVK